MFLFCFFASCVLFNDYSFNCCLFLSDKTHFKIVPKAFVMCSHQWNFVCVCVCWSCILVVVHPPARSGWPGQGNRSARPKLQHEEHQDPAAHSGEQQCETHTHTRWHAFTANHCTTAISSPQSYVVKGERPHYMYIPCRPILPPTKCHVSRWGSSPPSLLETLARCINPPSPGGATYQLVKFKIFFPPQSLKLILRYG